MVNVESKEQDGWEGVSELQDTECSHDTGDAAKLGNGTRDL
jgi:hypothetical protein